MELLIIILVIFLLFSSVAFVKIYNRLIAVRANVDKSWANIDVLLKQRHEELPKLVDVCKAYMNYEKEMLERIVELRNTAETCRDARNVTELSTAEGQIDKALTLVIARAEAYPDLKSNESFQKILRRISVLQDSISDRIEYYNASVTINNTRIRQIPDVFLAKYFDFGEASLYHVESESKMMPDLTSMY